MRVIEIMDYQIEFLLKDSDGNERLEYLEEGTTDFIESMLEEGYSSGELNEVVFDKEGCIVECTGNWNIKK